MQQRILAMLLTALLLLGVFPVASAAESSEYADVALMTQTIYDDNQEVFTVGGYLFVRGADHLLQVLSPDAKTVYLSRISEYVRIKDALWLVKFDGSNQFALYRGLTRLTDAIYSREFEINGDCVVLQKSGLPELVDLNGNPLSVGRLPSGYVPYAVSAVGTVLAKSQVNGLDYLFDRNGNALITKEQGLRIVAGSEIVGSNAGYFNFYDLNGNRKYTLHPQRSVWIGDYFYAGSPVGPDTEAQQAAVEYKIYGPNLTQLGSITCNIIETLDEGYFFFKDREGRFGLAKYDGTIVVPGQFAHYNNGYADTDYRSNLYKLRNMVNAPKAGRVAFSEPGKWYVYDLNGNLVLQSSNTKVVILYEDCIAVLRKEGHTQVYDPYGSLLFELPQGQRLESCSGVLFRYSDSSERYYVIDRQGNQVSPSAYKIIASARAYGLVNVSTDSSTYLINANGERVIDSAFSYYTSYVDFGGSTTGEAKYTIYFLNNKKGVCKYLPPARACAESATGQHRWQQTTVHTPATCTETGLMNLRCVECGAQSTEAIPIDPENHAWSLTEILAEGEADGFHMGTALYTCSRCNETKEDRLCAGVIFTDMPAEDSWAHAPIDWAYFNGITAGKSATRFAPKDTVTRAEAMTFLWLTCGRPEPVSADNPFEDVKEGSYYSKPVRWAVENRITSGTSETTFSPKNPCTRAQILTFIWIAAGRPKPETTENPFQDVNKQKYYYKAVLWGVENRITSGVAPDKFGPGLTCTRAQIVAFLYKAKDLMNQTPVPTPDPDPDPEPSPDPEPTEPEATEPTEPPAEPIPDPGTP